ncbi:hypothetical protein TNCV_1261321 [Trichonephila clavipes]|nr:hypothetical protein TNCV_1261321 [Trichonephila clavipes]
MVQSLHSSGYASDSDTASFKGHRSSSPLVLHVQLPQQPLSSVFVEEGKKLTRKVMQKIEEDPEGPRQLARRSFEPSGWTSFTPPINSVSRA